MKFNTPRNFKEELIMSLPNGLTMAMGMMTINLWIYGALTMEKWVVTLPFIFMTAFCLDFFIIGKIAMAISQKYNTWKYQPLYRVLMMAGILTFVAPIVESFGANIVSGAQYLTALPRNYMLALVLQVLVAMPLGNYVLGAYQKNTLNPAI